MVHTLGILILVVHPPWWLEHRIFTLVSVPIWKIYADTHTKRFRAQYAVQHKEFFTRVEVMHSKMELNQIQLPTESIISLSFIILTLI